MNKAATQTVLEMGNIKFRGHTIPHIWYQKLAKKGKFGSSKVEIDRPYLAAIVILSDVCYWYRPRYVTDEETNELLAIERRFHADKLQRSYKQLSKHFGLGKEQARLAVKWLEDQGYITLEFRKVQVKGGQMLSNVLYLEPVPKAIKKLNDETGLEFKTPRLESKEPRLELTDTYTEITTETSSETTTAPKVVVPDPLSPSGNSSKKGLPISTSEDESIPGFRVTRSDDEPRILTLTPHPRAYKLVCTDCGAESDWQASDSGRRKHSLICQECGAHFIVKTESPKSGVKHTYSKPVARVSTSFWVQVDDAPKGFQSFKASQADAELLHSMWKATNGEAVLKGLKWMAGKKTAKQWGNVAVSLILTIERNGKRENSWGSKSPPSRPSPRPETDWNAVMEEAAKTNADFFPEEDSE